MKIEQIYMPLTLDFEKKTQVWLQGFQKLTSMFRFLKSYGITFFSNSSPPFACNNKNDVFHAPKNS
jgi:hypothetical protein